MNGSPKKVAFENLAATGIHALVPFEGILRGVGRDRAAFAKTKGEFRKAV
jgi:hypothetical protein